MQLSFQHIDLLEQKVGSLTTQLEKQYNVHRSGDQRLKQAEDGIFEMQERLKRAESELASADMLRDSLRADKERVRTAEHCTYTDTQSRLPSFANVWRVLSLQYLRFLEDLSVALKMESINADLGVESILTSLLARVQQVVGKEGDLLVDRKTHIYNLQRKIKSLKEQLDSKELHMDLLRKKVR